MELLKFCGITDDKTWRQWAQLNHPDKGGDSAKFALVMDAYQKHMITDTTPTPTPTAESTTINVTELQKLWTQTVQKINENPERCIARVSGVGFGEKVTPTSTRRCHNKKLSGSDYCRIHNPDNQCKAEITVNNNGVKTTRSCRKPRGKNSNYCKMHDQKISEDIKTAP